MKHTKKSGLLALAVVTVLAGCQAGLDSGRSKPERTILFEAPGIFGAPRTRFSEYRGLSTETIRWGSFESEGANASVDHWHEPLSRGFLDILPNVSELPGFYMLNKEREIIVPVGNVRTTNVPVGDVSYVRARAKPTKNCVIFQTRYRRQENSPSSRLVQGWYCAPASEPLPDETIHSVLASLGVKGWRVP